MKYSQIASMLQKRLGLDLPPVALALVNKAPTGIPHLEEQVPSACALWRRAEQGVFYASAEAHTNCPIGAMVMGFEFTEDKHDELMSLVGQMCEIAYIREEEVSHIPRFDRRVPGVVYGPLASFPLEPDVTILWTTAVQAMMLQEAAGTTAWKDSPQNALFGRPACGVLPSAVARGELSQSLGCMGMRTFTEIPADRMLVAIPGSSLNSLSEQIEQTLTANNQMEASYLAHKAKF